MGNIGDELRFHPLAGELLLHREGNGILNPGQVLNLSCILFGIGLHVQRHLKIPFRQPGNGFLALSPAVTLPDQLLHGQTRRTKKQHRCDAIGLHQNSNSQHQRYQPDDQDSLPYIGQLMEKSPDMGNYPSKDPDQYHILEKILLFDANRQRHGPDQQGQIYHRRKDSQHERSLNKVLQGKGISSESKIPLQLIPRQDEAHKDRNINRRKHVKGNPVKASLNNLIHSFRTALMTRSADQINLQQQPQKHCSAGNPQRRVPIGRDLSVKLLHLIELILHFQRADQIRIHPEHLVSLPIHLSIIQVQINIFMGVKSVFLLDIGRDGHTLIQTEIRDLINIKSKIRLGSVQQAAVVQTKFVILIDGFGNFSVDYLRYPSAHQRALIKLSFTVFGIVPIIVEQYSVKQAGCRDKHADNA